MEIIECLYYATTDKLQAGKECCSHNRLCASVNPALSLMVQHFSEAKQTNRKCQNDLMLYLSRCKRKDMKNNGNYISNENRNNVDRHIEFVCRKYHLFIQNFSCF